MRLYLAPLLIIAVGIVVFFLPVWLPIFAQTTANPEMAARCGEVGGGLIGLGAMAALLIRVLRKN